MEISWIRIYLLAGLLLHKAVWEFMKARQAAVSPQRRQRRKPNLLSAAKIAILFGIILQTVLPTFLPIASATFAITAVGVALYSLGLLTAIVGRIQLGWNWSDIEKSYVQREHALVAHGLYRYVRHPIYAGDVLLLLGLELALNSWCVLGALAIAVYVRRKAIHEEQMLANALPGYNQYCRRTTRFVPFLAF